MQIKSEAKHKSFDPIAQLELPEFVVLSGLNGGGKTQLLEGISQKHIVLLEDGKDLRSVKLVDHNTLMPNNSTSAAPGNPRPNIQLLINSQKNFETLLKQASGRMTSRTPHIIAPKKIVRMLREIGERAGKEVELLNEDEIYRFYPIEYVPAVSDIFQHSFSALFKQYQLRKFDNDVEQFRSVKYGFTRSLTDEQFLKIYGEPPWVLVNKVIADAALDYHTNFPEDRQEDRPFELKLINNSNGAEINFSDLSGGEKVIMSLALSLYNSEFDIEFPEALLMDEPDAHLHPSMTKKFLDVIQNTFVRQKGVRVIMTTHSPSTVALAPESSLYLMNKSAPRITKATKDQALRILTSGVPTLSINYENRRQVFVESKHDLVYYEMVFEKLRAKLVPDISLNFISSGTGGQGSCSQVKEIVNKLSGFGNRTIYGIVDWDEANEGNEFVKVLGKDKRHSIENYIFDPIVFGAFLLRERFIEREKLCVVEGERYTDFCDFDNLRLQTIADFIVNQVRPKVGSRSDSDFDDIEYVGGRRIKLPRWFLRIQGHQLETTLKELFPQLNRYKREGELKREIINKVIEDIPEFIPKEILTLFGEIQNFGE